MKTPLKPVLLSALVFPGLGQLMLKNYLSAVVFMGSSTIVLYFLVSDILTKVNKILAQVQSGQLPLTVESISKALSAHSTGLSMQTLNMISYLLVTLWIISIVDAYRISRKLSNAVPHS